MYTAAWWAHTPADGRHPPRRAAEGGRYNYNTLMLLMGMRVYTTGEGCGAGEMYQQKSHLRAVNDDNSGTWLAQPGLWPTDRQAQEAVICYHHSTVLTQGVLEALSCPRDGPYGPTYSSCLQNGNLNSG
jgi:hypothetical protein